VTHALALAACYRGAADMSCLQIAARAPNLAAFLPSIEAAEPAQKIAARHEGWAKGLPDETRRSCGIICPGRRRSSVWPYSWPHTGSRPSKLAVDAV